MPSSRGFPNPGIEPATLLSLALAGRFFTTSTTWEAQTKAQYHLKLERKEWKEI